MQQCPHCHGSGTDGDGVNICQHCDGWGVVGYSERDCPKCGGAGKNSWGALCSQCGGKGVVQALAPFANEWRTIPVEAIRRAITDLRTGSVPLDDDAGTDYSTWAVAAGLVAISRQMSEHGVPEGSWLGDILRGGGTLHITHDGIWHHPQRGVAAKVYDFLALRSAAA